jgi:hypothetical protein
MSGLSEKGFKFLKGAGAVKFFATVGDDGWPNVVPLLSATPWDKESICFVRFMIWKTRKNLEDRKKVAVCGLGLFSALEVLGEFAGFETSGDKLDFFNNQALYRYNAYFGAGQVGVIRVVDEKAWHKAAAWRAVQAKLLSNEEPSGNHEPLVMPQPVYEKFRRVLGAKFLSWIDDSGWPRLAPAAGAFPLSSSRIGVAGFNDLFEKFPAGKLVSLSTLSTEPSAYQVKGTFKGLESKSGTPFALIELEKSFSCAPPLPGEQIYPR